MKNGGSVLLLVAVGAAAVIAVKTKSASASDGSENSIAVGEQNPNSVDGQIAIQQGLINNERLRLRTFEEEKIAALKLEKNSLISSIEDAESQLVPVPESKISYTSVYHCGGYPVQRCGWNIDYRTGVITNQDEINLANSHNEVYLNTISNGNSRISNIDSEILQRQKTIEGLRVV